MLVAKRATVGYLSEVDSGATSIPRWGSGWPYFAMSTASETCWLSPKLQGKGLSVNDSKASKSDRNTLSQTQEPCSVIADVPTMADEDTWLVRQSLNGNRQAAEHLFSRYMRAGYQKALAILGSSEEAEDALQDALLSAFRNLSRFEGRSAFRTWLTRIVINAALMRRRSRRNYQIVPLIYETHEEGECPIEVLRDLRPTPEEELIDRELREILARAVYELPERSTCVLLHYLSDCSVNKIAELMGISVGAVKSTLHRARLGVAMRFESSDAHVCWLIPPRVTGDRHEGRRGRALYPGPRGDVEGRRSGGNRGSKQVSHVRSL